MEQPYNKDNGLERLAVKSLCAADILNNVVTNAENLQKLEKNVGRYIKQAKLILSCRKGYGVIKMVGSATKVVGGVMTVAAPLHPKLGLAVKVGHKLWKFGAGLKLLTCVGHMLKDLWQVGCRNALVEFVHATALLTSNLGVFGEVIQDLQNCVQSVNDNIIQTPAAVINSLSQFIPHHQRAYVAHVINMALGDGLYSPLFDFIMLSSDISSSSNIVQLMREMESFNFTQFVEQGGNNCISVIGSFLHISRELLDFLDGFHKVTEQDCRFLSECLTRFTQESLTIMKVASVLSNLSRVSRTPSNLET